MRSCSCAMSRRRASFALIDRVVDLVIATPTVALAERTVRAMLDALAQPATAPAPPIMLPFELYGPKNIRAFDRRLRAGAGPG
jgi:hypothetical protein